MRVCSFVKRFTELLPDGVYQPYFRSWFISVEECFSINYRIRARVRQDLKLSKTPRWVSECYQLGSLVFAIVLCAIAASVSGVSAVVVVFLSLYRPLEMFIFLVNWIFAHEDPLHSYKRSLAGFGVNVVEIVLYFAAAYVAAGCVDSVAVSLYSSLRTVVTIGPTAVCEASSCLRCVGLLAAQIGVAYFLIVVVVASAIGGGGPRPVVRNIYPRSDDTSSSVLAPSPGEPKTSSKAQEPENSR